MGWVGGGARGGGGRYIAGWPGGGAPVGLKTGWK